MDLARLAGLTPARVFVAEVVNDDGVHVAAARAAPGSPTSTAWRWCRDRETWSTYRRRTETLVGAGGGGPAADHGAGEFLAVGYRQHRGRGRAHGPGTGRDRPPARVSWSAAALGVPHRGCARLAPVRLRATAGSTRCGRWPRRGGVSWSICAVTKGGGIGLLHKLAAYRLQDGGRDTVDANLDLGLPADARDFSVGAPVPRRPRRHARCGCSPTTRPSGWGSRSTG